VWQNFSLLFDVIDSVKYLGYAMCQAYKIRQLAVYRHDTGRTQYEATHLGSVYCASKGKDYVATILSSFESEIAMDPECRSRLRPDSAFFFRTRSQNFLTNQSGPGVTFQFRH